MLQKSPAVSWKPAGYPRVSSLAFVHPTAVLIGEVVIHDGAIIFPLAIIRADEGFPIIVGENTNVQDGVIIHCLKGGRVEIGRRVSLAHGALIHGPCVIGDETFVGFRAMVINSRIGRGCFIGHGALIEGVEIPDGKYIPGLTRVSSREQVTGLADLTERQKDFAGEVLAVNGELKEAYKRNNNYW
ncbi:MAG TPA: transferase [Desulfotomaculum sp.]|nr:transferase [Desulfotomaculum sp.]